MKKDEWEVKEREWWTESRLARLDEIDNLSAEQLRTAIRMALQQTTLDHAAPTLLGALKGAALLNRASAAKRGRP